MGLEFDLAQVQEICGSATHLVTLDPGEFLFREGDPAEALFLVKEGVLRIVSGSTV
jgi:CRP-like cAMP-binding protein